MSTQVSYQNWPRYVKVVTAMSNPKLVLKSPTFNLVSGYLLFILGIIEIIYRFFMAETSGNMSQIPSLGSVFIGLASIVAGYAIKWISNNSTWEERFANTPSKVDKCMWFLVTGLLFVCLYLIVVY
jgi:hypothetical protein